MKTINALVILGITSLVSACGGSGSDSGASSSSVSSMVESVSSQSSAVSVDASSADASSSSVASSVADVSSSSPAISSAEMSSSSLAVSSVAVSTSSVVAISSADASSSSLAASSIEASSSSLVSSSSVASSSSLATSSASAALYPSYNTNPIAADMTGMDSNATQLAAKIKLGINVGNQMESRGCTTPAETCWGHPMVSEAYVKLIKDSGFDAIRLPVAWEPYADQITGKISDVWLNRVKEVVQYAVDNELYVIVNIHWDGGWLERNFSEDVKEAVNAKQKAYWEQIATTLRDFDEHVLFASANEPDAEDEAEIAVLDMYHQTFVDAVRSTGGKNAYRVLVIQGPKTDIDVTFNSWPAMPSDTATGRQMAEVHFYPFSFTNQDEDIVADWGTLQAFCYWGEGHHSETDTYRNSTREEEDYVDEKFAQMKAKFADQGIPVVLGEFAARPRTEEICTDYPMHLASRAYYAQYVTQAALENGMLPFYWDTGDVFERGAPAVNNQQTLDALLIGSGKLNGGSSSSQSSSSSVTVVSSSSSSSSSSAAASSDSNLLTLDMNSSNWEADNGVVMNQSDSDIQLTLSSANKVVFYNIDGPINLLGAKFTVLFNFDSDYVASVNAGVETGILQFMSVEKTSLSDEFKCWTGWYTIVAGQDVSFSCDQLTKNNPQPEGARIGIQFFGNTGTVTIKSATIQLAE